MCLLKHHHGQDTLQHLLRNRRYLIVTPNCKSNRDIDHLLKSYLLLLTFKTTLKVSDDERESEPDSFPTNSLGGPSTAPRYTSTSTPTAPKLYKTASFDEVSEPTKLYYTSYPNREHKQTQCHSEHGFI